MNSNVDTIAHQLYNTAKANGWYPLDSELNVIEKLIEETEEAQQELIFSDTEKYIDELIDVLIVVLARLGKFSLDGELQHKSINMRILRKDAINKKRGWKHGGKGNED